MHVIFTIMADGAADMGEADEPRVLVRWFEGARVARKDGGSVYENKNLRLPHLIRPKQDWSILKISDIVSVRWIVADFDEKDHWWVIQYDGFSFHQLLGED